MRLATAFLVGLTVINSASADTLIDDFENFDPTIWPISADLNAPMFDMNSQGPTSANPTDPAVPGVRGGVRQARVDWLGGPSPATGFGIRASIIPNPNPPFLGNVFGVSLDAGQVGSAMLTYPGDTTLPGAPSDGNLNLDLTYAGDPTMIGADFVIEVTSCDLCASGGAVPITLELTSDTDANNGGAFFGSNTQNAVVGTTRFPLSAFTGSNFVDFSDVDKIGVVFQPNDIEYDLSAQFIGFDWPDGPTVEPEPASILIWSLVGVLGLVAGKRFYRKPRQ